MGNCQAVEAAALVIQHPCGKLERMYWPLTASEVMKTNPGHYVSLIIPLPLPPTAAAADDGAARTVRFTRVKLLRPSDTLVLGRAYRLVTTQEVVKVLRAKKHAKMKRNHWSESHLSEMERERCEAEREDPAPESNDEDTKCERQRQRSAGGRPRPRSWRPALQSISEAAS